MNTALIPLLLLVFVCLPLAQGKEVLLRRRAAVEWNEQNVPQIQHAVREFHRGLGGEYEYDDWYSSEGPRGGAEDDDDDESKEDDDDDSSSSKRSKGSKGGDDSKTLKGDDDEVDDSSEDDDSKESEDDDDSSGDDDDDDDSSGDDDDDDDSDGTDDSKTSKGDDDGDDDSSEDDDDDDSSGEDDSKESEGDEDSSGDDDVDDSDGEDDSKESEGDDDSSEEEDDDKPAKTPSPAPTTKKPSSPTSPTRAPTEKEDEPTSKPSKEPTETEDEPTSKPTDEVGATNCVGDGACEDAHFSSLGSNSCMGDVACTKVADGDIGDDSCQGENACSGTEESEIGDGSCICEDSDCNGEAPCVDIVDSAIGDKSCKGRNACVNAVTVVIGSGSCNCDDCCADLPEDCEIPDNVCSGEADSCSGKCPTFGSKKCQDPETSFSSLSDGSLARIADNFVPSEDGTVSKVTFYGAYVDGGKPTTGDDTPDDHIKITYYEDDGNGLPGEVIAGPFVQGDEDDPLDIDGPDGTDKKIGNAAEMYKYEATHPAVMVSAGTQYWMEIVNVSDGSSLWFWVPSYDGDLTSAVDGPPMEGRWESDHLEGYDLAYCLEFPFDTEQRRFWDETMRKIDDENSILEYLP